MPAFRAASEASTEITELKLVCLNNLAAVQIKMAAFDLAIGSCDRALSINPSSAKALYRKAQVRGVLPACCDGAATVLWPCVGRAVTVL